METQSLDEHVLAAVDRQRFGGVQRPRSGRVYSLSPISAEQPGRRRQGRAGRGEGPASSTSFLGAARPARSSSSSPHCPGHSMGAHPRQQPPPPAAAPPALDPPLARPIRSLRHGQHGGHYHSGGERSRQPARGAPAAGTRLALSLPPSLPTLTSTPRLPARSAARPAWCVLSLRPAPEKGVAATATLCSAARAAPCGRCQVRKLTRAP